MQLPLSFFIIAVR